MFWKKQVIHMATNKNADLVLRVAGDKARKVGNSHYCCH